MQLKSINPYIRAAMIQPAIMEGRCARMAYDHRLFYILEGTGTVITEEGEYSVGPNTILFFRPGYGYYFRQKLRVIVINFDMTRAMETRRKPICPVPASGFNPSLLFDTASADELASPLLKADAVAFKDECLELVQQFDPDDPIRDAMVSAILKKILAELGRDSLRTETTAEKLCENIRRYIRLCIAQIKKNGDIAQYFGYHPVYLAQLFKETTGESLHHAVVSERIRLAKEWLAQTDQTVDEIAFGVGYATRSHFCTGFKAFTGMSPAQYRKNIRKL